MDRSNVAGSIRAPRARGAAALVAAGSLALIAGCSDAPGAEREAVGAQSAADSTPNHLTYHGGPLLQNVNVSVVRWGSDPYGAQLDLFYSAIVDSPYLDWLSEYNAGGMSIGRGTIAGSAQLAAPTSKTVDEAALQAGIQQAVEGGTVPEPDGQTVYVNHLPLGVDFVQAGARSCQDFCATHGELTVHGKPAYYIVLPNQDDPRCASGCGGPTGFERSTLNVSHELLECITDPAVSSHMAWYDDRAGEIASGSCLGQSANVAGYTVAPGWSNAYGTCIASPPDSPPPPPPPPPTCAATTACGGIVTFTCSSIAEPQNVSRSDSSGQQTGLTTLSPGASDSVVDQPPGASATYIACSAWNPSVCTQPVSVTANHAPCSPPPTPKPKPDPGGSGDGKCRHHCV